MLARGGSRSSTAVSSQAKIQILEQSLSRTTETGLDELNRCAIGDRLGEGGGIPVGKSQVGKPADAHAQQFLCPIVE